MSSAGGLTILCIATYEKGQEFLRECARQGHRVLLLTADTLRDADWPREAIDEFFYISRDIGRDDLVKGVSHVARTRALDRIVPLDDFDVETAALLREHLRIPGMGETTARYFRDKLAMRVSARNAGILVPDFVHVLNDDGFAVRRARRRPGCSSRDRRPPRSGSSGSTARRSLAGLETLGDRRSFFLLEQFVPGDVYPRGLDRLGARADLSMRRTGTASRRWRSRTTAACSPRAPCRMAPTRTAAFRAQSRSARRRLAWSAA